MSACPVCNDSCYLHCYLLDELCPLCDGDPKSLEVEEASDHELFACLDGGRHIRVVSEASNAYFSAEFSVAKLSPPRFCVELHLGGQSKIQISSLTAEDAQQIAAETALVPQAFPGPCLEVCKCLLQFLGRAELQRLPVTSSAASPAEAVCIFYDELCKSQEDPKKYEELLQVNEVLPGVFHVHTESRLLCASLFIRPQQFYEDPDPGIRGRPHSLAELRAKTQVHGPFDFYLRWPGFNLPSRVFDQFRQGMLGKLEPREMALVASIGKAMARSKSGATDYYVIGTCEEAEALHHEMAHGLYATNAAYRHRVQQDLQSLTQEQRAAMRQRLLDTGYSDNEEIISDEIQAYMAGGDELCYGASEVLANVQQTFRFHAKIHVTPYTT